MRCLLLLLIPCLLNWQRVEKAGRAQLLASGEVEELWKVRWRDAAVSRGMMGTEV